MGSRRWWLVGAGLTGDLSGVYHYLGPEGRPPGFPSHTACGIKLPAVYGRFYSCLETPKEMKAKRCKACVAVRAKV